MNKLQIDSISLDEFKENLKPLLKETLAEVVKELNSPQLKEKPKYGTRKEVAAYLHISLPTLDTLSNEGYLVRHYIGNRVLYEWNQVEDAVSKGLTAKYRKG